VEAVALQVSSVDRVSHREMQAAPVQTHFGPLHFASAVAAEHGIGGLSRSEQAGAQKHPGTVGHLASLNASQPIVPLQNLPRQAEIAARDSARNQKSERPRSIGCLPSKPLASRPLARKAGRARAGRSGS
jgi:hypothetical protein